MEEQMSYENYLAASVVEEIVYRIAESEYAEAFWLKKSNRFNKEAYQKKVNLNLEYLIKETAKLHYNKRELSNVFSELFRNYKRDIIHWNYGLKEEEGLQVHMTATIDAVKVPVKLYFAPVKEEKIKPEITSVSLVTNQNKQITIQYYPGEQILVEKFIEILEKMELMGNLAPYFDIYDALKKEAISGRQVWELLSDRCKEQNIEIEEKRFATIISYRKNRFMQKKWKTFLRHEKKSEPSWDEVLDFIDNFFGKIWGSMCNNVIYLGDWMPELGRFID